MKLDRNFHHSNAAEGKSRVPVIWSLHQPTPNQGVNGARDAVLPAPEDNALESPRPTHTTHTWLCGRTPTKAAWQSRVSWECRQSAPLPPHYRTGLCELPGHRLAHSHRPGVMEVVPWGQPSGMNSNAPQLPREPTQEKTY